MYSVKLISRKFASLMRQRLIMTRPGLNVSSIPNLSLSRPFHSSPFLTRSTTHSMRVALQPSRFQHRSSILFLQEASIRLVPHGPLFSTRSFYSRSGGGSPRPPPISPSRMIFQMIIQGITSFIVNNPLRAFKIVAILLVGGYIATKLMSFLLSMLFLSAFLIIGFFVARYYWYRLVTKRGITTSRSFTGTPDSATPPFDFSNFSKNFAAGSPFASVFQNATSAAASAAASAASTAAGAAGAASPLFTSMKDVFEKMAAPAANSQKLESEFQLCVERAQDELRKQSGFKRAFGADVQFSTALENERDTSVAANIFKSKTVYQVVGSRGMGMVEMRIELQLDSENAKHTSEKVNVVVTFPTGGMPLEFDFSRDIVDL